MLARLERDLSDKIDAIRKEVEPLERELSDVRRARAALEERVVEQGQPQSTSPPPQDWSLVKFRGMTMKQLTLRALQEHFPNGATANELIEFFARTWGRKDIVRESFSPQLSRLKREGKIKLHGKVWSLANHEASKENEPPEGGSNAGEATPSPDPDNKPEA